MNDLPFKKEEDFDYILDEADRKKFAPKLKTDEFWGLLGEDWQPVTQVDRFHSVVYYRRRKSSGWVSVTPESLPNVMTDDGQMYRQVWACRHNVLLARVIYAGDLKENREDWQFWAPLDLKEKPQPPRPAAEVAFDCFWFEDKSSEKIGHVDNHKAKSIWLAAVDWAKSHKGEL